MIENQNHCCLDEILRFLPTVEMTRYSECCEMAGIVGGFAANNPRPNNLINCHSERSEESYFKYS